MKQRKGSPIQGHLRCRIFPFAMAVAMFLVIAIAGCNPESGSGLHGSETAAMREVRELAGAAAVLVDEYMDSRVTEMLVGCKLGGPLKDALTISEARTDASSILEEWLKISRGYEAILLLDKNGVCLASAPAGLVNRNFSDGEAFQGAVKGQLTVTDAHKSDVLISLDPRSKGWTAIIAVPVRIENEVAGVLMSFLRWSQLRSLMLSFRVGKTGYAYVVNRQNQVIIHPAEDLYGIGLKDPKINRPEVEDAITRRAPNAVYEFRNVRANRLDTRIEGFAYPGGWGNFPGLGWTVGAGSHEKEILAGNPFWRRLFRWIWQNLDNSRQVPRQSFQSP
jgi:methyl-accepting chemotaxis protein